MPVKTYVATKNLGKLHELEAICRGGEFELDTYPMYEEAPEDEPTYAGNAQSKARGLHAQLRKDGVSGAVLADDSGIEVAALGGRPGVLSARYGGKEISWQQRREKLLQELASIPEPERGAKFCCAVTLILENGETFVGYGEVEGAVTTEEHGRFGFGYDPVFWYPPAQKTFAELAEEEKNRVSHRARAVSALLHAVKRRV